MTPRASLDDYIDVAERIVEFNTKYPEGSLQTISWEVREVGGAMFVVYRAAAFRTPDDQRPGHGTAWEPFPGQTPFTRNSELMNAETAAWGRAIVAVGLTSNRKLASRQEVKARMEEQKNSAQATKMWVDSQRPQPSRIDEASLKALRRCYAETGWTPEQLQMNLTAVGVSDVTDIAAAMKGLSEEQAGELLHSMNVALDQRVAAE